MTVYTDSFTGSNGSAPNSSKWTRRENVGGSIFGVVDIQGNRCRMNTPNLAYYTQLLRFIEVASVDDFELYVEFQFQSPQVEQYPVISWRTNGVYNEFGQPQNGMSLYFDVVSSDEVGIERWASGSNVYSETTGATFSLGVPISVRLLVAAGVHKVKWWTTSGSEPTSGGPDSDGYQIKKTDTTLTTGEICLAHGALNLNIQTFWDNYSLTHGGAPIDLAVALNSVSSLTADMQVAKELVLPVNSVSSLTAVLQNDKRLETALNSVSSLTAALQLANEFIVDLDSVSNLTADLQVEKRLEAALASGSSATFGLEVAIELAMSINSVSTITADLPEPEVIELEVALNSVSNAGFALETGKNLSTTINSVSTVSADIEVAMALVAFLNSVSNLAAILQNDKLLALNLASVSTVTADLQRDVLLGLNINSVSTISADLPAGHVLQAFLESVSQTSAELLVEKELSVNLNTTSDIQFSLSIGQESNSGFDPRLQVIIWGRNRWFDPQFESIGV